MYLLVFESPDGERYTCTYSNSSEDNISNMIETLIDSGCKVQVNESVESILEKIVINRKK